MRVDGIYPVHFRRTRKQKTVPIEVDSMDACLRKGLAIEVPSAQSRKHFPVGRVAVCKDVHERFVLWGSWATRQTGMYLEEDARLLALLIAASQALRHSLPAYFVHKAIPSDKEVDCGHWAGLYIRNFEEGQGWLICMKAD